MARRGCLKIPPRWLQRVALGAGTLQPVRKRPLVWKDSKTGHCCTVLKGGGRETPTRAHTLTHTHTLTHSHTHTR